MEEVRDCHFNGGIIRFSNVHIHCWQCSLRRGWEGKQFLPASIYRGCWHACPRQCQWKGLTDERWPAESLTVIPRFFIRVPTADSCSNDMDSPIDLLERCFKSIAPCQNHTMPDTLPNIYQEWPPCKQQYQPSWFLRHVEVPLRHALVRIFFHTTHIPTHPYHHSQSL